MDFEKKHYTFRGMDGMGGFRHGNTYELEVGTAAPTDEQPAEIVIVNPVSKLWMYFSKAEFAVKGVVKQIGQNLRLRRVSDCFSRTTPCQSAGCQNFSFAPNF